MAFICLDDKTECSGYYSEGKLFLHEELPNNLDKTWKYNSHIKNKNVEFANYYCNGKDYAEVCPEELLEEWQEVSEKTKSFIRSFIAAKVSLKDNCFYDLLPHQFLYKYCDIRAKIVEHVLQNYEKPKNYDFIVELEKLIVSLKNRKLNFSIDALKQHMQDPKIRSMLKRLDLKDCRVIYNQFASKTGRLTTEDTSFPILNLNKKHRNILIPKNDFFVEIDYNAAEVRTFLALNEQRQPEIDIHEWNMKEFSYSDRNQAKQEFIAWLYGAKNVNSKKFKKIYDSDLVKNKYWNGESVTNIFERKIPSDDFHAVNYIVQSTTADLVLRQVLKTNEILVGKKSEIAFIIHDSVVFDIKKEEKHLIDELIKVYSSTQFGKFKCSVKIGKNLGEMKKIL